MQLSRHTDTNVVINMPYRESLALVAGYTPTMMCADEVLKLHDVVPQIEKIVKGCQDFLAGDGEDKLLDMNERMAIALYSYDLLLDTNTDDFYYLLNKMLQKRDSKEVERWRGYLHYLFTALNKIKNEEQTVYRGIESKLDIIKNLYTYRKRIHWSAFSSSTTDIEVAKKYAAESKIMFRINVVNGKDIQRYSVFKGEKEILLHPNMKLVVNVKPKEENGFWVFDLLQTDDSNAVVF